MRKVIINFCIVLIMIADTLMILMHDGLTTGQGLNLLLNGYVIGICTVILFSGFMRKEKKQEPRTNA